MFAILIGAYAGGLGALVAATLAGRWEYLLAAPLSGSAVALAVASFVAMRRKAEPEEGVSSMTDLAADEMVLRLRQARASLANYDCENARLGRALVEGASPENARRTIAPRR